MYLSDICTYALIWPAINCRNLSRGHAAKRLGANCDTREILQSFLCRQLNANEWSPQIAIGIGDWKFQWIYWHAPALDCWNGCCCCCCNLCCKLLAASCLLQWPLAAECRVLAANPTSSLGSWLIVLVRRFYWSFEHVCECFLYH